VEYKKDLSTVVDNSDVISLHAPLAHETRHIIRAETIKLMKPGSIVINVNRGRWWTPKH